MKRNGVVSNVLWKFAERFSAQIVSLAVSIVLARILSPDDYGVVAIVLVFISIADILVSDGLGTALIQKKNADNLDFSSTLFFNIAFSSALYLIVFFAAPLISSFYELDLTLIIRVFGIRIIVASINSIQQAYVAKKMMFRTFFFATLFGTIISSVVGLAMDYYGCGVWSLIAQYLTNTIVDTIILAIILKWKPCLAFSIKRVGKLFKFGWKILFEGVSNKIVSQARNLIVGKVYSSDRLGYYTKAQQFPNLITTNTSAAIGSVLLPAMSEKQEDLEEVKSILRKSIRLSNFVILPMLVGLAAASQNFVLVLLTEKWINCVPFIIIFSITNAITIGMTPRHQALNSIGKSNVYMIEHMIGRTVSILILLFLFRISPIWVAITDLLGTLIQYIIIMFTSKKYNHYSYKEQISDIMPTLVLSLVMGVTVYSIGLKPLQPLVGLFIQVLVGVIVYFAGAILLKYKEMDSIINIIKGAFSHDEKQQTTDAEPNKEIDKE